MTTSPYRLPTLRFLCLLLAGAALPGALEAQTELRIVPVDGVAVPLGQRFDIRVEATAADPDGPPPRGLRVEVDGREITALNILDPGARVALGRRIRRFPPTSGRGGRRPTRPTSSSAPTPSTSRGST